MAAVRAMRNPWSRPSRPHTAGAASQKDDDETANAITSLQKSFQRNSRRPSSSLLPHHLPPTAPLSNTLFIEGSQTGQIVATEGVLKKVPDPDHRKVLDLDAKVRRLTEALERERKERVKDQALIKKLQDEIQRLNHALLERDQEVKAMNGVIVDLRGQLSTQFKEHQVEMRSLQDDLQRARDDEVLASAKIPILVQGVEECRIKWLAEQERSLKCQAEIEEIRQRHQDQLRTLQIQVDAAQRKTGYLGNQHKETERHLSDSLLALQNEVDCSVNRIQELEAELQEHQQKVGAQDEDLRWHKEQIAKCNKYLQRICQPQFSVVKDRTLAPVDPNSKFDVVEGHVLVPLQLLLEGYALLPETMRQVYNQTDYRPPSVTSILCRPSSAKK